MRLEVSINGAASPFAPAATRFARRAAAALLPAAARNGQSADTAKTASSAWLAAGRENLLR